MYALCSVTELRESHQNKDAENLLRRAVLKDEFELQPLYKSQDSDKATTTKTSQKHDSLQVNAVSFSFNLEERER